MLDGVTLSVVTIQALAGIPPGTAKTMVRRGLAAATSLIALRTGDGRLTAIATTSSFPKKAQGPASGALRLRNMPLRKHLGPEINPFVLESAALFCRARRRIFKATSGGTPSSTLRRNGAANSSVRTAEQTAITQFWTANVIASTNRIVRDVADHAALIWLRTARLAAMVNIIAAERASQ